MVETTIIIVNWNGLIHLKECLPSLKNQFYSDYELIVVDNASIDDSINYVKKLFQNAKIIQLKKNIGFAKPNNIAFREANGKYVLTLNNDIVLKKDFLQKLVAFLKKQPDSVYAVNPKILYFYESEKINTIGIKLVKNGSGIHIGKNDRFTDHNEITNVFGVSAGCALYRKDIIDKIGYLFDETYFAYLEDVDLSIRAHLKNYTAKFYPDAVCFHKHSATSVNFPYFKFYLMERNRFRNLIKYYPWKYVFFEPFFTIVILIHGLKKNNGEGSLSADQKNMLRNIFVLIKISISARIATLIEMPSLIKKRKKLLFFEKLKTKCSDYTFSP